ncbi:MAG: hypothetical protein K0S61_2172 [Anaerocolumna sp.]|nr:hypothetical protein [Anaerocolumna sp.]
MLNNRRYKTTKGDDTIKKHYQVIENILELLNTIEEGILYAQSQIAELLYEEAFTILQDTMEGISCIESALEPMKSELIDNNIDILFIDLKEKVGKVVDSKAQEQQSDLEGQISKEIFPIFLRWKEEMEKTLKPYIVS